MATILIPHQRRQEAGFSMVEMLMTAVILAVGILGLTMLQLMSIRTARGAKNLTTATQLAEHIMDRVEMEGRLTWLNSTQSKLQTPPVLSTLDYIGKAKIVQNFTAAGLTPQPTSAKLEERHPFFTVTYVQGAAPAATAGKVSDCTVTVDWTEQVDGKGKSVPRSVTLMRRIVHG